MNITVAQEQNPITVKQAASTINIVMEEIQPDVIQELKQITVQQEITQIIVQGVPVPTTILPFSVTATSNGQTVFTLPYAYTTIVCLFIMGTGQDPIAGDYTVSGNVVTLGASAPAIQIGDLVFGSGQL